MLGCNKIFRIVCTTNMSIKCLKFCDGKDFLCSKYSVDGKVLSCSKHDPYICLNYAELTQKKASP